MIIGLDLSLTSSAYCILNQSGDIAIQGLIKNTLRDVPRLIYIYKELFKVLSEWEPELVVVENYSFGSRGGKAFSIGELGGIIKVGLHEEGYRTLMVPPTSLKLFITGKGNSAKSIMIMKTLKKYDIEFTDDNLCDAFGLAKLGQAFLNGTDIEYEKKALAKISSLF